MKEIPVLFNGAMVRAIIDDRKTQTRRIVKPQPWQHPDTGVLWIGEDTKVEDLLADRAGICKYLPGDRLWVRETFWMPVMYSYGTFPSGDPVPTPPPSRRRSSPIFYSADGAPKNTPNSTYPNGLRNGARSAPDPYAMWVQYPSIHMPRWAARLFLDVLAVRIERLQDISEEDARAEGVEQCGGFMTTWGCWMNYGKSGPSCKTARESFQTLWISVYGAESWAANPWVWVIEFKRATATQTISTLPRLGASRRCCGAATCRAADG